MLNIWGWRPGYLVLGEYQDISHVRISATMARGPTNGHDRIGLVAHYRSARSFVGVLLWPDGRLTLNTPGDDGMTENAELQAGPDGGKGGVPPFQFWTVEMKTEPGEEEGTLAVSVRVLDPDGAPREIHARAGEYAGGWWTLPGVPAPPAGVEGTAGVQVAVANGGDSPDRGLWVDSITIERLTEF
jgi:hypothetical protein